MFCENGIQGFFFFFQSVDLFGKHSGRIWVCGWLDGTGVESLTESPRNFQKAGRGKITAVLGRLAGLGPSPPCIQNISYLLF